MTAQHDVARDVFDAMYGDAGVPRSKETPNLVPGSDRRPADVLQHHQLPALGWQRYTTYDRSDDLAAERIALDVTLTNTDLSRPDTLGIAAETAFTAKMSQKVTAPDGGTSLLADVLKHQGTYFLPLAFERFGPHHLRVRKHILYISKIASHTRGHDTIAFFLKWTTNLVCATNTAIAKAALEQCRKSAVHNAPYYDGPIGAIGTDTPLSTGIDDDGRQFPGASTRPRPRGRACTSRTTLPAPHAASQQGSVGPGGVASCSTTDAASPPRLQSTTAGLCTSAASRNTRAVAARPRTLYG